MVEVPHIQVTVKLEEAQRYGLKPGDVRRASATLMAGEEVGDIFIGGRTYDVQVWTAPASRHSVDSVRADADRHADRAARPAGGGSRCQHSADAKCRQA